MKLSQKYLGTVSTQEVEDLKARGYDVLRRGSLVQVFGHGSMPSLQRVAFRGEVWKGPKRDSLKLHLDTMYIVKRMVPLLREELSDLQNPDIKLNYIRQLGHGHSLHILDQYRNETLDIHVAALPSDLETWVHWRLTHWTEVGRDVYEEGTLEYPEDSDWDDEKQQMKAVKVILKSVRKWLKGESA